MKGISPLIAAVLLIAFTVAIGGIVSLFFTSFTKQTTGSVGSQGSALLSCGTSAPTVDTVKGNYTTGVFNFTYSNPGSVALVNVVAYITLSNASTFGGSTSTTLVIPSTLAAYATGSNYTFVGGTGNSTPTEVRIVGVCVTSGGNQTVTGSCLAGQSCILGFNYI